MKKYIKSALLLCGCAIAFASCDENTWNKDYLDGFKEPENNKVETVQYTLTAADYASIANNATNKDMATESGVAAELKAVGTQGYFTDAIPAKDYIPALLSSTSFPYFNLNNGSAIKVTYMVSSGETQEEIVKVANSQNYTLTNADYLKAWGGNENAFVKAFTPANPAEDHLASILKDAYPDAEEGQYVVVNYNEAITEPTFEAVTITPIADLTKGNTYTVKGTVVAMCSRGYILADATGLLFVYTTNFDINAYAIGKDVAVTGTTSVYGGAFQFAPQAGTESFSGASGYTYPEPEVLTPATMDSYYQALADAKAANTGLSPTYVEMSGTVISTGNYINISMDGTSKQLSVYYATNDVKNLFTLNEDVTVKGYLVAMSGAAYNNVIITEVNGTPVFEMAEVSRPEPQPSAIDFTANVALYEYNGSTWTVPTAVVMLTPADYRAMGQKYNNLSGDTPEQLLPVFLSRTYPYAIAGDQKYVAYTYYNGSSSSLRCECYKYNGSAWEAYNGAVEETAQFVKNAGKWNYDPSVTITLPAGKGIAISTLYYQTCVDWVKANIDDPTGAKYVTSYGNNEYYSGTSAYQGNVDLRPSAARGQYAAGYEGMTDDEIVAVEKERFAYEVFPAALGVLHADAAPVPGIDVIFTINFSVYTGTTEAYTIRYKVVDKGKFEFIDCTWDN